MRLRLYIKFALWLLLTGTLPLAIIGSYSLLSVKRSVQETIHHARISLGDEIAREVNRIIDNGINIVDFLAENPLLTANFTTEEQLANELIKTQRFHPIIKDLTLLDRQGEIRASALYSFRGTWAATSWFQEGIRGKRTFTGVHSVLYPFDIVMTTAAPVFRSDKSMITGVLVGQLSMKAIWDIFDLLDLGNGAKAMLINERGAIIASADHSELLDLAPADILKVIRHDDGGASHLHREGEELLVINVPLKSSTVPYTADWHVIFIQPTGDAYGATRAMHQGLLLASAVSLLVVALVSTFLSNHINNRLRPLIDAARNLGHGDFPTRSEPLGSDEIGELGEAFFKASSQLAETTREVHNYQEKLEDLVNARTRELQESNAKLHQQIEERIQMEEEQKKLESLFRQSQKMEAVGTLAGGIAHDFNNILQIISGQIQLLLLRREQTDPDHATLTEVDLAISRASELVRRLLTFSRKMESTPKRMNMNELVATSIKLLSRTIPKMITIETALADDLFDMEADYNQMEQILMNLVANAADAMPEGGTLRIQTENCLTTPEQGDVLGVGPGDYIVLRVVDTGHGMDETTQQRIFEPFFTLKEIGKGTGLGLSTVYGIVKDHAGHIGCISQPGGGTEFTILLPATRERTTVEPESPDHQGIDGLSGLETILVVDDETIIREIAEDILSRFGYKVYLAKNGEEALAMYMEHGNEINLVLTDVGMPGMGGQKLLQKLLDINPRIKVVIASGYLTPELEIDSVRTGAQAFIKKPYTLKTLLKTIRGILDQ